MFRIIYLSRTASKLLDTNLFKLEQANLYFFPFKLGIVLFGASHHSHASMKVLHATSLIFPFPHVGSKRDLLLALKRQCQDHHVLPTFKLHTDSTITSSLGNDQYMIVIRSVDRSDRYGSCLMFSLEHLSGNA